MAKFFTREELVKEYLSQYKKSTKHVKSNDESDIAFATHKAFEKAHRINYYNALKRIIDRPLLKGDPAGSKAERCRDIIDELREKREDWNSGTVKRIFEERYQEELHTSHANTIVEKYTK